MILETLMKFLEQRIEELEQQVRELKVKLFQKEWKESPKPWENVASDYLYNPSLTMLSEPELETAFASPWDASEIKKNPLDTITVKQKDDSDYQYPGYPNILGSWDEGSRNDVITSWGFASEFDKADEGFLNYLSSEKEKNPLDIIESSPTSANFKKAYEEVTKARKTYDKELNNHFSFSESSECLLNSKKCKKKS